MISVTENGVTRVIGKDHERFLLTRPRERWPVYAPISPEARRAIDERLAKERAEDERLARIRQRVLQRRAQAREVVQRWQRVAWVALFAGAALAPVVAGWFGFGN